MRYRLATISRRVRRPDKRRLRHAFGVLIAIIGWTGDITDIPRFSVVPPELGCKKVVDSSGWIDGVHRSPAAARRIQCIPQQARIFSTTVATLCRKRCVALHRKNLYLALSTAVISNDVTCYVKGAYKWNACPQENT